MMFRALTYLRLTSLKNRILVSGRRLRQPKYLLAAVMGAVYLYYFAFARFHTSISPYSRSVFTTGPRLSTLYSPALLRVGGAVIFVLVLWREILVWKSPPKEAGLRFSEAEIAFLFPAPVSRRGLVLVSLLKNQLLILFSSLFLSLMFNRTSVAGGRLIHALGWWVILSTLNFHTTAASLTVARWAQIRPDFARLRRIVLILIALITALAAWSFYRSASPPESPGLSPDLQLIASLGQSLDSGFLHFLLLPFTWVVAPFLAFDLESFLRAFIPAFFLLVALYAWIVRLEVPFEDGSIALAEKRSLLRSGRHFGPVFPRQAGLKPLRDPFRLADHGRPETAFLWKNLFAIQSWFNLRLFLTAIGLTAAAAWSTSSPTHGLSRGSHFAPLVLAGSAMLAAYTLLAGPQLLRHDLRGDLANADILKTYPLAGWQVVLGELLTPLAILSGLLWLALLTAVWALGRLGGDMAWFSPSLRIVFTVCLAVIIPPVCVLQLLIPNGAALLFPSWFQATRTRGGGVEVIGQRLIFAGGQFLAILAALVPAVTMAALIVFASQWLIGLAAASILATLAVLSIVIGEAWCGLWWLGVRFEKFDVSSEV
jgi:ABC-2 type transport system permease protein